MSSTRRFMVLAAVLSGAALAAPATVFGAATSETGEMADTVQPVTFWIAGTTQAPNNELGPDLMQNKWIQENFGIAPTVKWAKDDPLREFTLMRTTRNLPDVFRVPNLQVFSEIVRDGMAKELDAYFTDPSGYPHLAQIPKVQLAFASVGDHVYAVPVSYDRDLSNPSAEIAGWLLMQKDLPGKLGMSTPDTLDDLVAALKEVKSRGLTGFNDQPMFPLGFGRPQRLVAFGDRVYGSDGSDNPSLLGMSMHLDDAGRVVPGWATQERYEGLKLANMLWREGLIDPETFTQKSDVLHPKIANGRYAFFYGSYGDAWAYIAPRQADTSKTRAEIDAWFGVHDLVAIPRISVAGVDSTSIAVHNPYPRRLTVLNTSIAQPAADRVMQFVDWMQTRDGMFTQYYEGWPDGTWLYDEQGTPRRNFPWNTYTEMMQVYWDYHFPYVYLFGYHWLRDLLEAGADVKRDEPWWYWLYDVQRTIYSQPGNLKLTSALGNVIPGPVETDLSAKIEDIWAKNWAKIVTAESDAQFERDYQSLIDQLMKSDWREVVAEKQQLWEQFKRDHPEVAAVTGYPTATAIAAIR